MVALVEVTCISHSGYRGVGSPSLLCKTCCGIYTRRVAADEQAKRRKEIYARRKWWGQYGRGLGLKESESEVPSLSEWFSDRQSTRDSGYSRNPTDYREWEEEK